MTERVTRGSGLFEGLLARQRTKMANKLIAEEKRQGRVLDIGCGIYPYFLLNTRFNEKYGLDKVSDMAHNDNVHDAKINLRNYALAGRGVIPFDDDFFDVVTMLAVFEHIEPCDLITTLSEIKRVLKPHGMYILTTPAKWTAGLLRLMAKLGLLSSEEIDEHKDAYTHARLKHLLIQSGFEGGKLRFGYFEFFLNIWVSAIK